MKIYQQYFVVQNHAGNDNRTWASFPCTNSDRTMQETVTGIDMNILLSEFIGKAGISVSFSSLVFQLGLYIGSGFSNFGGNGHIRRVPQTPFRVESSWIFPTAFPSFPTGYNRKERGKFRWIPTWNTASMIRWIPLNSDRIWSVRFDLGC